MKIKVGIGILVLLMLVVASNLYLKKWEWVTPPSWSVFNLIVTMVCVEMIGAGILYLLFY